jgi:hypothetical protein
MADVKRNRQPLPDSAIFSRRGTKVKWPTLRGAYLTDESIAKIRRIAFGVIFLEGEYNTRLNFEHKDSKERAVFFEHLHRVDGDSLFLLCWIGNYHAGAIFHCAWQFPQHLLWPNPKLELAAFKTYRTMATILYEGKPSDPEVHSFLNIFPTSEVRKQP